MTEKPFTEQEAALATAMRQALVDGTAADSFTWVDAPDASLAFFEVDGGINLLKLARVASDTMAAMIIRGAP